MLKNKWVWWCKECKYVYEHEPEDCKCVDCGRELVERFKKIMNKGEVSDTINK